MSSMPGTIIAYRKDGRFPDGAVLVKEVYRAVTGQMTTGSVSHADSLRGWFVMMKDSRGHYAGNDLWSDGWGWSWFDAANPSTPSLSLPLKGAQGGRQGNVNRLQSELQTLSSAGASVGVYLRWWIPGAEAVGVAIAAFVTVALARRQDAKAVAGKHSHARRPSILSKGAHRESPDGSDLP
jgi:hypothetical protein